MKKILLVEDHPDYIVIMRNELLRRSTEVDVAHNGDQAIALCEKNDYSLCVLDFNLPDQSGLSLTNSLRSKHPSLKIAVVTAHEARDIRLKFKEVDISFVVQKPLTNSDYNQLAELA